jgi:hypothetical protein
MRGDRVQGFGRRQVIALPHPEVQANDRAGRRGRPQLRGCGRPACGPMRPRCASWPSGPSRRSTRPARSTGRDGPGRRTRPSSSSATRSGSPATTSVRARTGLLRLPGPCPWRGSAHRSARTRPFLPPRGTRCPQTVCCLPIATQPDRSGSCRSGTTPQHPVRFSCLHTMTYYYILSPLFGKFYRTADLQAPCVGFQGPESWQRPGRSSRRTNADPWTRRRGLCCPESQQSIS